MDPQADELTPQLRLRQAVRAVVLDPDRRILLVRFEFPDRSLWACPGGGLEPDETDEQALRRELAEEAGLVDPEVGPCIWTRTHIIRFIGGAWDGQVERFYLVETEPFNLAPRLTPDELRAEFVTDVRWWTAEELDASREMHAPSRLPSLVARIRADGPPPEPIDAGV